MPPLPFRCMNHTSVAFHPTPCVHVQSFKSSGLEEKAWRKQAATSVNAAFAWLEDKRDGKQPR